MNADEKIYAAVEKYISELGLEIVSKKAEKLCDRIDVKSGIMRCPISVFNSGKIVIGGADSELKVALTQMKHDIEAGGFAPARVLPFDIEKFPSIIQARIPHCDPVIIGFIYEAKNALRNDLLLSATFLLGAASEKAVCVLIDAYADAIRDDKHRTAFKERMHKNKMISKKFDEFTGSFRAAKTQPADTALLHDSKTILEAFFHFYRITRNEVGHPWIAAGLDKGLIIANMAQFIRYLSTIYGLHDFFKTNKIDV